MATATMNMTKTNVLLRGSVRARHFARLQPTCISSIREVKKAVANTNEAGRWISFERSLTEALLKSISWPPKPLGDALIVHELNLESIKPLEHLFHRMVFCAKDGLLPDEELSEVLASSERERLFIGGMVDPSSETITLVRGDLSEITAPFSAFPPSGDGTAADFTKFKVVDFGQTVQLGDYEASTDSILYENDAKYRREVRKNLLKSDESFGGSLRRLRIQRQLGRDDFYPLSEKTIARIERGEVNRIQPRTKKILAEKLHVRPEEIAGY